MPLCRKTLIASKSRPIKAPRTLGERLRAWRLERERLERLGTGPITWRNQILQTGLMTLVLWGVLIVWLGAAVIPFLLIQAGFGYSLLTSANYVEHYGLLRRKLPDGRYERCQPQHS